MTSRDARKKYRKNERGDVLLDALRWAIIAVVVIFVVSLFFGWPVRIR